MHREIVELLPFYVNGTLAPHERDRVAAEIASCGSCAAELTVVRSLHAALHDRADTPPVDLLARTLARIDALPATSGRRAPWFAAATWSGVLTLPAQFALAAVLVVGGGAVGAGIVRATTAPATGAGGTVVYRASAPEAAGGVAARPLTGRLSVHDLRHALRALEGAALAAPGVHATIGLDGGPMREPTATMDASGSPAAIERLVAAIRRAGRFTPDPSTSSIARGSLSLRIEQVR